VSYHGGQRVLLVESNADEITRNILAPKEGIRRMVLESANKCSLTQGLLGTL
jgi:hypothetical protein